jgi:hypothetical protein
VICRIQRFIAMFDPELSNRLGWDQYQKPMMGEIVVGNAHPTIGTGTEEEIRPRMSTLTI